MEYGKCRRLRAPQNKEKEFPCKIVFYEEPTEMKILLKDFLILSRGILIFFRLTIEVLFTKINSDSQIFW